MDLNTEYTNSVKLLKEASKVVIFIGNEVDEEAVLSSLALKYGLEKQGKKVDIYCDAPVLSNLGSIPEIKNIPNHLSPQNFIISLGYDRNEIERVGYDTEDGKFNPIITPKQQKIDPARVTFQNQGLKVEAIILVGVKTLSDLGLSYQNYQDEFITEKIININNFTNSDISGVANLINNEVENIGEVLLPLFDNLQIDLSDKIADFLLTGIYLKTESFQKTSTKAQTFIYVSELIKRGAILDNVVTKLYGNVDLKTSKPFRENSSSETKASPTPFVKGQEEQVEITSPVFDNSVGF